MPQPSTTRRDFLRTTGAAGTASLAALSLAPAVHAAGDGVIKVGLVGCGGRGTGAATQALRADSNVQLVALGDAFPDKAKASLETLKNDDPEIVRKLAVRPDHLFSGFDAYKQVIDACDVVLLCTPPHFRPAHMEYAIEKGKHLFVEKPVAVDPVGVRRVLKACEAARKKKLSVVSGLCWRYHNPKRETFKRVHGGAIGDIVALQCTYNTGTLWKKDRTPEMSDVEWQVRNWLYFTWLSGDHIVEQAVHSLDKMGWAMRDVPPIKASAVGGRQVRTRPDYGHIYDHFSVVYEYADGVKMFHTCRQMAGCDGDVSDHVMGTKGVCDVMKHKITGAVEWAYNPPPGKPENMYQTEHNELFASIRASAPLDNGDYMCRSTMLAILGRMAAYSGKTVKWDDAINSDLDLTPKELANGVAPGPLPMPKIAMPGQTRPLDTLW